MIITRLSSGQGNQMFQYALGRSLALRNCAGLGLDISYFGRFPHLGRTFALDIFNLPHDIKIYPGSVANYDSAAKGLGRHLKKLSGRPVRFVEKGFSENLEGLVGNRAHSVGGFNPSALEQKDNTYLVGFWNNQKYFLDFAPQIRKDFTYKHKAIGKNAALLKEIASRTATSLHVRRGDYVATPEVAKTLGSPNSTYYDKAVELIRDRSKDSHLYVFSDDPEWCKKNLKYRNMTIVSHNPPDKGYEDMRLMSACKHNIIANSTFSWWAAWLNSNKDKLVVAPKTWYKDPLIDTSDVVPPEWIRR